MAAASAKNSWWKTRIAAPVNADIPADRVRGILPSMRRPSVLVTDGTGFPGAQLCRFLAAQGFAVRSLDSGAVRDPSMVAAAMRGVGYVVHTAAADTRNVLQAAVRNRVDRVVFLSSSAVYGAHEHHLMHEADELRGSGPEAASRIEAEYLCQDARLGGLCVPILRCADIVGPGCGGLYGQLFEYAAAGRHFFISAPGWRTCQVLDLEDVCAAVYRCLTLRAALVNDTFNLGAADFSTVRDCFQAVLDQAGHGKRVISLPWPLAAALRVLESRQPVPVVADNALSVRHIENKLDFRARHSSPATLLRHAPVISREPTSYSSDTGFELAR